VPTLVLVVYLVDPNIIDSPILQFPYFNIQYHICKSIASYISYYILVLQLASQTSHIYFNESIELHDFKPNLTTNPLYIVYTYNLCTF